MKAANFAPFCGPGRIDDEQARKLLFGREAAGYSAGGVGAARESAVIARSVRPVARDEKARDGASAACRQLVAVVNAFAFEHVDEELADPERRLGRKIQINVVEAALPDRAKGGEVLFKPGGDSGRIVVRADESVRTPHAADREIAFSIEDIFEFAVHVPGVQHSVAVRESAVVDRLRQLPGRSGQCQTA